MKKRIISLLLVLTTVFSLLPAGAVADEGGDGFHEIQLSETDYSVYTKTENAWTYGGGLFTSGNAGVQDSFSTVKIVANKQGLLTFDWSMAAVEDMGFFAYRTSGDYTSDAEVLSQTQNMATGKLEGTETGFLLNAGDAIYLTYYRNNEDIADYIELGLINPDEITDNVTISNLRIEDYIEADPLDVNDPVVFDSSMGTVTAQWMEPKKDPSGNDYIHLSSVDESSVAEGNSYRLKAVAKDGYQFYGWVQEYIYNGVARKAFKSLKYYTLAEKTSTNKNGEITRISNERQEITTPEFEVKIDGNSKFTAVFAPEGSYIARVNCTFYDDTYDLTDVINNAVSGDVIEILQDVTLNGNATVKRGVTLYVPFRSALGADDEGAGKYRKCGGTANAVTQNAAYRTLTVANGASLTVNGTLAVGSVIGARTQGMQGHISGAYGEIVNNGQITISTNGTMIAYGLVSGNGTVLAQDYGVVKESLIVCDFSGGSNSLSLYTNGQIPFKRFAMQNIQCTLQLQRYGTLSGLITIYAVGGFNEVEADVVGVTNMSIFRPNDSGTGGSIVLSRTYSPQYLASGTGQSSGVGKTTWNLYGGLEFRSLTLDLGIATVKTDQVNFPIPAHMDFEMNDGLYDIPGKIKLMPGSHMTVGSSATLRINGKLLIFDGLVQAAMSGYANPTRAQLSVPGYGGSASFTLNGTLRITEGSTLGGLIQSTSDTGILIIEEGSYLTNTGDLDALDPTLELEAQSGYQANDWVQQDGGRGHYSDNTTWFNLPARIYNGTEVTELTAGTWKSAVGVLENYEDSTRQFYCTNGSSIDRKLRTWKDDQGYIHEDNVYNAYLDEGRVMTGTVDSFTRAVNGIWTESTSAVEITSNTVAGSETTGRAASGVKVNTIVVLNANGSSTLTIETVHADDTPVTEQYVHLVRYMAAGSAPVTVTADAETGAYTIPAEATGVTIETALLGDVNGDGRIKASDAQRIIKISANIILNPTELEKLAADVRPDGKVKASDAQRIIKYSAGQITAF